MNRFLIALLALGLSVPLVAKDKDKDKPPTALAEPSMSLETEWEGAWAATQGDWAWSPGLKAKVDADALVPLTADRASGLQTLAFIRTEWEPIDPSGAGPVLAVRSFEGRVLAGWRQSFAGSVGRLDWDLRGELGAGAWVESLLNGGSDFVPLDADARQFWTRLGPAVRTFGELDAKSSGWRWQTSIEAWGGLDPEEAYGGEGTDLLSVDAETTLTAKVLDADVWEVRLGSRTKGSFEATRIDLLMGLREQALIEVTAGKRFEVRLVPISWDSGAWGWSAKVEVGPSEHTLAWEASGLWTSPALTLGLAWKEAF